MTHRLRRRPYRMCSVPGCHQKHLCQSYCTLHYGRWYTTGTTDPPPPAQRQRQRPVTPVERAEIVHRYAEGLSMRQIGALLGRSQPTIHGVLKRLGAEIRSPGQSSAERHSLWKGQRLISHRQFHRYLGRQWGPASNFICACGAPAEQWSYNDSGVAEVIDTTASKSRGLRFSTDITQYRARCRTCHLVFDGHAPLPLHEIVELRECWATGEWPTVQDLAADFGIRVDTAKRIVAGETWKSLTRHSPQVSYWRREPHFAAMV